MKCKLDEQFKYLEGDLRFSTKGNGSKYGLWRIRVNGKKVSLSRHLAELVLGFKLPNNIHIDHVDRDTNNNLLSNLRLSTCKLNNNNKSVNPHQEVLDTMRLDYGRNSYGNRVRTPKFYAKTTEQVEKISKHFHSLCQGVLAPATDDESELEFKAIFSNEDHYSRWMFVNADKMSANIELINADIKLIEDLTGCAFGTTLDRLNKIFTT